MMMLRGVRASCLINVMTGLEDEMKLEHHGGGRARERRSRVQPPVLQD